MQLNYNNLLEFLKQEIQTLTGIPKEEVKLDSDLIEDLGLDSLDLADIEVGVELEFDAELDVLHLLNSNEKMQRCVTVKDWLNDLCDQLNIEKE